MKGIVAAAAVTAVALCTQAGLAQTRMLQFDLNNLHLQARDGSGANSAFGGLSHTGSVVLTEMVPPSELAALGISTNGGPFIIQGGPWTLASVNITINLSSGNVTGGTFNVAVTGGDSYTANIGNVGSVAPFVGGGFTIEGLTNGGHFSDATFGTVNISDFFNAQSGSGLNGSLLSFRINPDASGAGFADVDAFVSNVPTPGTISCLAAAALVAIPRRRRR